MSVRPLWVQANQAHPGIATPDTYEEWASDLGDDSPTKGHAAVSFGMDDPAIIYGDPREVIATLELALRWAHHHLDKYAQPGCYVGPDNQVWIATHAEGDPCEQAVTTHDCPRTHNYAPVSGKREFSFDCHECGHAMVEEHPIQEGDFTHIESRCPQCGTALYEDFDNEIPNELGKEDDHE